MLTTKQMAHLRGLAHDLKPVVLLGHKGLTEGVVAEVKSSLLVHELIKVRLSDGDLDDQAEELAALAEVDLCGRVGRIAIYYQAHPTEPRISVPSDS
jgi:RNA-binding protein